jgi:hypothetical protein
MYTVDNVMQTETFRLRPCIRRCMHGTYMGIAIDRQSEINRTMMQRIGLVTHLGPILDLRHRTPASPCPRASRPSQNNRRTWLAHQQCCQSGTAGSHQAKPPTMCNHPTEKDEQ